MSAPFDLFELFAAGGVFLGKTLLFFLMFRCGSIYGKFFSDILRNTF
jgi:hypothetical protein